MPTPQRWGSEIFISGLGNASEPQITALADGRFVVAWVDNTNQEVRAQILNADGSLRGSQFTINATSAGEQQLPNITALSDGRFVAVWTDQRDWQDESENADIYGQIFGVNGARIGSEFKINDGISVPPTYALAQPDITTLSDGGFAVTWRDHVPEDGSTSVQVWRARYDSDGVQVGTISALGQTDDATNARPVIEGLDDGRAIMIWTEENLTGTSAINLYGRIVNADGSTAFDLGNIGLALDDADNVVQINPQVTRLKNGNFVVTWKVHDGTGGGEDYAVWARVFSAEGVPQATAFEVAEATGAEADSADIDPVVTALNDGRFMVTWADYHAYGTFSTEIKSQVYSATGVKDGDTFTIHTPDRVNDRMPSVSTLIDGRVAISWWHDGPQSIRAQIIDPREAAITLVGTALDDDYVGTRFRDELAGGEGNDILNGGLGADVLDGGAGFDFVSFASATSGVVANMTGGTGGEATGDVFTAIEGLIGSSYADTLYGNGNASLQGGRGNDLYRVGGADKVVESAGGGSDTVYATTSYALAATAEIEVLRAASASPTAALNLTGSNSANTIIGNAGRNTLKGLNGNDKLYGGAENDVLYGGVGNDVAYGGTEHDTLLGEAGADTLYGDAGDDRLYGGTENDLLYGGIGNDQLKGDAGNDKLYGGAGKDVLYGGAGKDVFVFDTALNRTTNLDRILDYSVADDTLWLDNKYMPKLGSGSAAKPVKLNAAYFAYDVAKDANDHLIYNRKSGVLSYDADGSGAGRAVEIAILKPGLGLTYHDVYII